MEVPDTFEMVVFFPSTTKSALLLPLTALRLMVADVPVKVNAIPVPGHVSSCVAGLTLPSQRTAYQFGLETMRIMKQCVLRLTGFMAAFLGNADAVAVDASKTRSRSFMVSGTVQERQYKGTETTLNTERPHQGSRQVYILRVQRT